MKPFFKKFVKLTFAILLISTVFKVQNAYSQMNRNEIEDRYKWNLKDLYQTDEIWRQKMNDLGPLVDKLAGYKGKLGESGSGLNQFLEEYMDLFKELSRLSSYASMKSDEDKGNTTNLAMDQEISAKYAMFGSKLSFVSPELSSLDEKTIKHYLSDVPGMKKYEMFFDNLWRQKKHILTDKEERIMAEAGKMMQAPYDIYGIFSNAEMPNPTVELSTGEKVYVDKSAYGKYRTLENRADREKIFHAFWKNYGQFQNTFAQDLYANVNTDVFVKNARGFNSCLEASLSKNNIPVEVYYSLIENINKSLPTFHRYLNLKKRILGVDTLKYSDTYVSGVKGVDLAYDYEEGKDLVVNAVKLLGEDYSDIVRNGFNSGWVDVYPNKGKRSGAYSNGSAYDVHPYILMNYNGYFDDVSTLAHEFGHTMHSYYSNKNQDFVNADYSIFVAEVASTLNERLLDKLVLDQITDKKEKLSLLMTILDGFRTTLFRQTQFAEFELKIHEEVEKGNPITADVLNRLYKDILYRYYGHNEGVTNIEEMYEVEWAYIPHFYYNFYVFQYSTSFTASMALSYDIINGNQEAVKKYIKFLSSGSSKYPIDLLKETGVDMTTAVPFEKTMAAMNYYIDEVEKIINSK